MSEKHYEFEVLMSCSGCSGAVERVLKRLDGVTAYTTSLETQKVNVTADSELAPLEKVKEVIGKTGKRVVSAREVE